LRRVKTTKEAALMTVINVRTAQQYIKKYNDDEERQLPVSIRKVEAGRKAMLRDIHSKLLVEFIDEHPHLYSHWYSGAVFILMGLECPS
jgi:predicted protein tyrosine phosphatase